MDQSDLFERLALALAIGLLIGAERGWKRRNLPEGMRVAGVRTFALLGLFGGILGVILPWVGGVGVGLIYVCVALLLLAGNLGRFWRDEERDITTEVAALLTGVLGFVAVRGDMVIAAAAGVIVVALLDVKATLHAALARIEAAELQAAVRLLLISVVVLPILPDRGFGPEGLLNPYALWWLVILVATISFAGYAAVKLAGPRLGLMLTGLLAGLTSSTALAVTFARRARSGTVASSMLAGGIAVASATMFVRLLVILAAMKPELALKLAPSFGVAALGTYGLAFFLNRRAAPTGASEPLPLQNPLDLSTALLFAGLLAVMTLFVHYARIYAGEAGLLGLAALSGLVDVDALSLSMANAAGRDITLSTAATAIVIAAFVNTAWKVVLAWGLGGRRLGQDAALAILPPLVLGCMALVLF